jgi:hypothetical protein
VTTGTLDLLQDVAHGARAVAGDSSEHDLRIANLVQQLYGRALMARRPLIQQWKKNYRVLNNKMWGPRAESWMPAPEIAEIWPTVASMTSWMTDQRPVLQVTPSAIPFSDYADFYQQLANDMNALLTASFIENSLDAEVFRGLWDVATYGIGYFKTTWEPWLADGLGDSVFRRVDPFNIYPDPNARNMAELAYIIEAKLMPLYDVERAYPGARQKLGTNAPQGDQDHSPHKLDPNGGSPDRSAPDLSRNLPNFDTTKTAQRGANGAVAEAPMVLVLECWIRGFRTEDIKDSKGRDTGETKVFDEWRCIVTCGSKVLLDTDASELNAYNTHPYDRLVLFDTGEWYGPCLVEFLASPQESINRILASVEQNIMLMGNPQLVESPRSTSRNKRLTNRPGQRIEAEPNTVAWMNPPQMQPQIAVQLMQFYQSKIESISGLSAMVRGFSSNGRNSTGVMDSLQDAAFVRIRASLRELERALRGCCAKMCANIAEFYTEPRLLSLLGPDGDRTSRALRARHFYIIDNSEEGERIPMRFNLLADAGSQLPTSKQARSADAERLYAMGAIDGLEVLKAKQWPNYGIVAKRVMEQQAIAGQLGQPPGARQRSRN